MIAFGAASFTSNQVPLTNLPSQLSSFIGRERERAEAKRLLDRTRLLTLTGTGGCGKTRLAVQVAEDLVPAYKNGAWFVDLSSVGDLALVPQTISSVFNLPQAPDTPLIQTLCEYFRTKTLLLVLDNCEHLVNACAQSCDTLLRASPNLRILATSREPLNIAGETCFRVPSLTTPEGERLPSAETLLQYESIQLFIARAAAADPGVALTDSNARAVAQICQRLDGMPLAIELAAARVRAFSLEQLAARLDDRFRLLVGGSRAALPRQQALRATMDWSYELLSASEQVLFHRLSAFSGGWTLEAAETVASGDGVDGISFLGLHAQLVDKSLVLPEERGGTTRYRLLETVRQYARDRLLETGDDETLRNRHLDCFLSLAEEIEPKLRGPAQLEWLDRLDAEHDNLRAALEWSLGDARIEKGMRLASALRPFWVMRGYWSEGRQRAESLLSQPQSAPRTLARANALLAAAATAYSLGDLGTSRQYLEESIAIAREHGESGRRTLVWGLVSLSDSCYNDEHEAAAADAVIEEGLGIARTLGDEWLVGLLLYQRGWLFIGWKDPRAARGAFEESLVRFQSLGDRYWSAVVSCKIALADSYLGDYARARQATETGLAFFREAKSRPQVLEALTSLGLFAHAEGDYDRARSYYTESLEMAREFGGKKEKATCSINSGYIAVHDRDLQQARALFSEALALARELRQNTFLADSLMGLASIAAAERQARQATQLFAFVKPLIEAGDQRSVCPSDKSEYAHNLAIARRQLDRSAFNKAWQEGEELTKEQAIAEATQIARAPSASSAELVKPSPHVAGLTDREIEVLRWLARGLTNQEIADKLVLSRRTVHAHLRSIYGKLDVTTRNAATRVAIDNHIV